MPGTCLYCYNETGAYEVGYHIACAKKMFGHYPPPLMPFTAEQLQKVIKSQPEFIIERKKKGAEQARIIPAKTGAYEIRTPQAKPLYLPEAEDLCLKMAALVGIETVNHSLVEDVEEELVLLIKNSPTTKSLGELLGMAENNYSTGSYEQLIKAIEKLSARPGLDKINMAERILFAFLSGCSGLDWGNAYINTTDNTLSPLNVVSPTTLLQPALANEMILLLGGKRSNINEQSFDRLFEKVGINTVAANNSKRKFTRILRSWFELVEESYMPERLKRNYIHILIKRAEQLNMM
jgi:serine/threonine-protein kinase HipA